MSDQEFKNKLNYIVVRKIPLLLLILFILLIIIISFNYKHHKYGRICKPFINILSGLICGISIVYIGVTRYEYIQLRTNYELLESQELVKYLYDSLNKKNVDSL
jgi:glucan phosphoethanolaminetransferase (alkaline phosphatase superfamily)